MKPRNEVPQIAGLGTCHPARAQQIDQQLEPRNDHVQMMIMKFRVFVPGIEPAVLLGKHSDMPNRTELNLHYTNMYASTVYISYVTCV